MFFSVFLAYAPCSLRARRYIGCNASTAVRKPVPQQLFIPYPRKKVPDPDPIPLISTGRYAAPPVQARQSCRRGPDHIPCTIPAGLFFGHHNNWHFNPCARVGHDLRWRLGRYRNRISIHVPAWGTTLHYISEKIIILVINAVLSSSYPIISNNSGEKALVEKKRPFILPVTCTAPLYTLKTRDASLVLANRQNLPDREPPRENVGTSPSRHPQKTSL